MTIPTITDDILAEIESDFDPHRSNAEFMGAGEDWAPYIPMIVQRLRQLEKDAARYAYLRQQNAKDPEQCSELNDFAVVYDGPDGGSWVGACLDTAIDAAMQADS